VLLPGYLRDGGLGSQTSGVFNAKISAATGKGEYVVHSGGGSKDRLYDVVGDSDGNVYNIGYSMNLVMNWGDNLKTTMVEDDVDQNNAGTEAVETHMYASKLLTNSETTPSCLTTCNDNTDTATVDANSCFIDGKCYSNGESGVAFGKSCFICDPSKDQRAWVEGPALGSTHCYIGGTCVSDGDALFYQRRTWSQKLFSECQICDPMQDKSAWTLAPGYAVDAKSNPPDDCTAEDNGSDGSTTGDGGKSKSSDTSHDNSDHQSDKGDTDGDASHDHASDEHASDDHPEESSDDESSGSKAFVIGNTAPGIACLMSLSYFITMN